MVQDVFSFMSADLHRFTDRKVTPQAEFKSFFFCQVQDAAFRLISVISDL